MRRSVSVFGVTQTHVGHQHADAGIPGHVFWIKVGVCLLHSRHADHLPALAPGPFTGTVLLGLALAMGAACFHPWVGAVRVLGAALRAHARGNCSAKYSRSGSGERANVSKPRLTVKQAKS